MTRASVLRAALVATVAALLSSLLVAFPGAAASAAPDPGDDHFWLPKRCVGDEPGRYVPDVPGPCYLTPFKKHRPTVVLWGDSHAWQHLPAVQPLAEKRRVNLVLFMIGGCPPILVEDPTRLTLYACEKSNQMALKFVRRLKGDGREVRVLLGAFWQGYYSVFKDVYVDHDEDPSQWTKVQLRSARTFTRLTTPLITTLGAEGVRVDLIGQATSVPAEPPVCLKGSDPYACALPRKVALPREARWKSFFHRMESRLPAASRVVNNFTSTYCSKTKCQGLTDGVYTYFDPTHLSASRAATFRRFFAPTFQWAR